MKSFDDLLYRHLRGTLAESERALFAQYLSIGATKCGALYSCSPEAGKARLFRAIHDLKYVYDQLKNDQTHEDTHSRRTA